MKSIASLILLSLFAFLSSCSRKPQLTIINRSATELTNVIASGTGFSQKFASIPVGQQVRSPVTPRGDSSLKLEFDAAGKHFTASPDTYFEANSSSKITVTIAPDFSASVDIVH